MTMDLAAFATQVAGNIAYIGGGRLMSWTAPGAGAATTFAAVVEDLPPESAFYDGLGVADSSLTSVTASRSSFTGALPEVGHTLVDADTRSMRIRQVIRGQDAAGTIQFVCGEVTG